MTGRRPAAPRSEMLLTSAAVVMVLCCLAGPAALAAVAGSVIGGWLGIACAVLIACIAGAVLYRRRGKARC